MLPPAARLGNADACRCRVRGRQLPSPQEERSDRSVRFKRSTGSRKSKIDIGRRASYSEGDFSSAIVESIPAKGGSGSSTRITWRLTHGTGTKESALETPDELVDAWSGSASVPHVDRWRTSERRVRWKVCRSEPHSRSARPTMARAGGALVPARAPINAAAGFSRGVLTFMDKRRWCQRDSAGLGVAGTGRNGEVAGPLRRRRPG